MEQLPPAAPALAGDNPAGAELGLPPVDPFNLTAGHLDRAFEALVAILQSPQARLVGKRPYDALRDALRLLDRYHAVVEDPGYLTPDQAGMS